MEKKKIRKGNLKDIKQCLELQKLDKEKYWDKKDFVNSIKVKHVIFLVNEEDNEILGYVIGYYSPSKLDEVMIHETRVKKGQRRKGIGKKLVREFCKEAFNSKAKSIHALIKKEHLKFYGKSCKFKISDKWIEVKKFK